MSVRKFPQEHQQKDTPSGVFFAPVRNSISLLAELGISLAERDNYIRLRRAWSYERLHRVMMRILRSFRQQGDYIITFAKQTHCGKRKRAL